MSELNLRPETDAPTLLFRIEVHWQGPPLDEHGLYLLAGLLKLFAPPDPKVPVANRVTATNESFAATFTGDHGRLHQLLQCMGVLRAFCSRFAVFSSGESIDDVTERLEGTSSFSYYPDSERATAAAAALAERSKPAGRPKGSKLVVE